ncbi:LysR substrate-binding domain-containing protein [Novosphingobium sp. MBES04]|uniref:LysR substrate-binding domain-containing protein n=1 Tax=Novosphingobium sp. MBES04 TaxID=1206458 RepID=UPI000694B966|nr:LysR substrate-binding domain-containing protein [Novosphingobium sp. MBES04]GAM04191.1 LysR family transcriptional regulator [Novosphingobium sp. MBES04]
MTDTSLYPPLAALRAFEAVGRLGGIRRAARELMIDHAVVSRHIRSLEGWVGAPLVLRYGNDRRLTDQGEVYHGEVAKALSIIARSTGSLLGEGSDNTLRVWCVPGFASLWLAERLGDFLEENPDIDVDFRPADEGPDFRSKDVDCDVRYVRSWEEDRIPREVRRLDIARPEVFPVASPAFLAGIAPIREAGDFHELPLLHEEDGAEWHHWLLAQGITPPERLSGPRLWHAHLTIDAACRGKGIALVNTMLLHDELATGRLVRVMPAQTAFQPVSFGSYALLSRDDRWTSPNILRFRRWIRKVVDDQSVPA